MPLVVIKGLKTALLFKQLMIKKQTVGFVVKILSDHRTLPMICADCKKNMGKRLVVMFWKISLGCIMFKNMSMYCIVVEQHRNG